MANEPNYSSNPSKDEPKKEKVRVIPLEYIDEFPGHPFKVLDDESMQKLMNSIEEIGVQSPIVARIKEDQRYEIISGHRRVHACRRLGLKLIPAIVRDLSRDEAIIAMVDANLQREHILPSEKAAAYKMKMEAMRRKNGRPPKSENSVPVAQSFGKTTRELVAEDSGDTVRRTITIMTRGFMHSVDTASRMPLHRTVWNFVPTISKWTGDTAEYCTCATMPTSSRTALLRS